MSQIINYPKSNLLTNSTLSRQPIISNIHQDSSRQYESMLEQDRSKFLQLKNNFEVELNSQKKIRLEMENKLIKIKDELVKKELIITDLEFEQNSIIHENKSLRVENQKLKNEVQRLESIYTEKIYELEGKIEGAGVSFDEATNQYMSEFEKFKIQGQEYIEALTYQYEKKIKKLEERVKLSEGSQKNLAMQNQRLNDSIIANQLDFDTQLRQTTTRVRNEDLKRSKIASKSFEQKFKGLQQSKQALTRRNQQLIKLVQAKQKIIHQLQFERNDELDHLNEQLQNIKEKNIELTSHYDKAKNQLNILSRVKPTSDITNDGSEIFKSQLNQKTKQISFLKDAIKTMKSDVTDQRFNYEKKQQDQTQKIKSLQAQVKRYKSQYAKICETLKVKINETISVVSRHKQ